MDRPYEKLIVWQVAHAQCLDIYVSTSTFPDHERYGLISQMRRSAASVPTNIVEGNARRAVKEKAHFFNIAQASLEELHYHARLSRDLNYITPEKFVAYDMTIGRIGFLLQQLRKSTQ